MGWWDKIVDKVADRIIAKHYAEIRSLDLLYLWPACVDAAGSVAMARRAFLKHTTISKAWRVLEDSEIREIIQKLEAPRTV